MTSEPPERCFTAHMCVWRYIYDIAKYKFSEYYYERPELWGNGTYDEEAPIPELVHSEVWRQVMI